jgi:SagB-type dehydrogenase family enzyme
MVMNQHHPTAVHDRRLGRKLASASTALRRFVKPPLYEIFHENTKLGRLSARAYAIWMQQVTRQAGGSSAPAASRYWQPGQGQKTYTLMEHRALPVVEAQTELERTIAARRSHRAFTGGAVELETLARLLFFTYGQTASRGPFRAVASGGALYPLEIYVVAFRIAGLEPGLYHYSVPGGHLDLVRAGDCLEPFREVVYWQGIDIDHASLAIVVTAAFQRSTIKYLDRGYRMILMEVGEAAQNLCLMATAQHLGACLLGGFNDDLLSEFLDIDGVEEAPLLPVVIGQPAAPDGS